MNIANVTIRHYGRKPGFHHLKPLSMEKYLEQHRCDNLLIDYPWIKQIKLVSNPYMYRSLARANYRTHTVELSEKTLTKTMPVQRDIFIRALCHFIAARLLGDRGDTAAYASLVNKYLRHEKGQSNSTGVIKEYAPEGQ